jgi:hypothetical protein
LIYQTGADTLRYRHIGDFGGTGNYDSRCYNLGLDNIYTYAVGTNGQLWMSDGSVSEIDLNHPWACEFGLTSGLGSIICPLNGSTFVDSQSAMAPILDSVRQRLPIFGRIRVFYRVFDTDIQCQHLHLGPFNSRRRQRQSFKLELPERKSLRLR